MTESNVDEVFLLGSGFSKAVNGDMPSLTDLSERVWEIFKEDNQKAKKYQLKHLKEQGLEEYKNDIELLMTYLSTRLPWLNESDYLRNQASFHELSKYIEVIISDIEQECFLNNDENESGFPAWLKHLVRYWHEHESEIITLNYDTILERAFDKYEFVNDDDGTSPPPALYPYPLPLLRALRANKTWGEVFRKPYKSSTFNLYKIHGSTNFYYSGLREFSGEEIFYVDPQGVRTDFHSYDREEVVGDKVPLIIPPVTEKSSFYNLLSLREIWKGANKAIQNATDIYIIGYSLPETDLSIRYFLSHKSNATKKIHLINIDHDEEDRKSKKQLKQHYENLLGGDQYEIFSDYVFEENPVKEFQQSLTS